MIDTGWKKEMDRLVEHTRKNWWKTGNKKKSNASGKEIHVSLEAKTPKRQKNKKY